MCFFFFSLPWIETNTSQLSKYPALNRFDKQLPVPKSYIAVGIFFVFTVVRTSKVIRFLTPCSLCSSTCMLTFFFVRADR